MRPFLIFSLFCSLSIHHLYCSYENEYWSNNNIEPTAGDLTPYAEYRFLNTDYNRDAESYHRDVDANQKVDDIIVSYVVFSFLWIKFYKIISTNIT